MTAGTRKKIINMMPTQKRHNFIGKYLSILFLLLLFLFPTICFADSAVYFYDDVGRVVRVAAGTEGLIYQYDKVGNLLSITKNAISSGPPVLQRIDPDVLFMGSTVLVSIKGQGLFTTRQVTSDNPFLSIRTLNITETEIRAEITVSSDALPDTEVNINVTTGYGTASIKARLIVSELEFSPELLILTPGSSGTMLASIWPSIGKDVTIILNNSNPSVASVPQSITIPSNGVTTFTVNALQTGISYIDTGGSGALVYVTTDNFTPLPGEPITTQTEPVSVYIETSTSSFTTTSSLPVSVYIGTPSSASTTTSSMPVSVYIGTPSSTNATAFSSPVSVELEGSTSSQGDTTVASSSVSVYIQSPSSANTVVSSMPVSVYIGTPSSASTAVSSLPVSVYIRTPSSTSATVISLPISIKINQP